MRMKKYSKHTYSLIFISVAFFLFFGCSSQSLEDFRDEGEGVARALTAELKKIRTRDDLLTHAPKLEQLFDSLVDIIIEAKKYKEMNPDMEISIPYKKDQSASDQLRVELNRVLHLEGGQEIIEKVQEKSLNRLNA